MKTGEINFVLNESVTQTENTSNSHNGSSNMSEYLVEFMTMKIRHFIGGGIFFVLPKMANFSVENGCIVPPSCTFPQKRSGFLPRLLTTLVST